jgi:hypothetical protein
VSHARVVNVMAKGATWDVYIGRGRCPRTGARGPWGNPWKVAEHGDEAMVLFLDFLSERRLLVAKARAELAGKVLGCWCAEEARAGRMTKGAACVARGNVSALGTAVGWNLCIDCLLTEIEVRERPLDDPMAEHGIDTVDSAAAIAGEQAVRDAIRTALTAWALGGPGG